jgi:hypothetical protein
MLLKKARRFLKKSADVFNQWGDELAGDGPITGRHDAKVTRGLALRKWWKHRRRRARAFGPKIQTAAAGCCYVGRQRKSRSIRILSFFLAVLRWSRVAYNCFSWVQIFSSLCNGVKRPKVSWRGEKNGLSLHSSVFYHATLVTLSLVSTFFARTNVQKRWGKIIPTIIPPQFFTSLRFFRTNNVGFFVFPTFLRHCALFSPKTPETSWSQKCQFWLTVNWNFLMFFTDENVFPNHRDVTLSLSP